MRTAQEGTIQQLGYITAIPLCYCKTGTSQTIASAVKNSSFDFSQLNFEIDRYIVDNTTGNDTAQYVLFPDYDYNI